MSEKPTFTWRLDPDSAWMDRRSWIVSAIIDGKERDLGEMNPSLFHTRCWYWVAYTWQANIRWRSSSGKPAATRDAAKAECEEYLARELTQVEA